MLNAMRIGTPKPMEHREMPDGVDALLDHAYRYAFSLAHDAAEAEDLLQDACLSILASCGPWERTYLFATIRNRFIDRYRRNRKILFLSLDRDEEQPTDMNWEAPDVLQNGLLDRRSLRFERKSAKLCFLLSWRVTPRRRFQS